MTSNQQNTNASGEGNESSTQHRDGKESHRPAARIVERHRDLEERTQAAETARDTAQDASRAADLANAAKSDFLAVMSHEFRTPLNAMIGYSQLLDVEIAGPLTTQQRDYVSRMTASARHLLGLVNDLLDLSKIDAGGMRVARNEALTGIAAHAAIDLVEPDAAAHGVQLVDGRPVGVPYLGDEHRVRQILVNLLSNAVKFSPRGGIVSINCDLQTDTPPDTQLQGNGPWAYIRVDDTGVGISPEEQSRIFLPFHQVEGGHTRKRGGTGLGLAISRQLARLMGGDLTVHSTPGVGSIFTLWLPSPEHYDATAPADPVLGARAQAEYAIKSARAASLTRIGELINESIPEILIAYRDGLRADPQIPLAREMRNVLLEDHAVSLLSDLSQSLIIVADAGAQAADLLRDGSAIQRTIAEAHGARRYIQGWDETSVRRDHAVFRREIRRAIVAKVTDESAHEDALRVLHALNDRAEAISLRSWRRSMERERTQEP